MGVAVGAGAKRRCVDYLGVLRQFVAVRLEPVGEVAIVGGRR